jgi:hypothetical protein
MTQKYQGMTADVLTSFHCWKIADETESTCGFEWCDRSDAVSFNFSTVSLEVSPLKHKLTARMMYSGKAKGETMRE